MVALRRLYNEYALPSYDKQHCLIKVVEGSAWNVNLTTGTLSFGADLLFNIQVLGTESKYSGTWLWVWANDQNDIPEHLLQSAYQLREFGKINSIAELTNATFPIDVADGHVLSMIACGICEADCYYRCPYEGGAAFVLVNDAAPVRAAADFSAVSIVARFLEFISQFEVDHRISLNSYLSYKGYSYVYNDDQTLLQASSSSGESLSATFDELGRVVKINT